MMIGIIKEGFSVALLQNYINCLNEVSYEYIGNFQVIPLLQ